jgi:hypothetical protein
MIASPGLEGRSEHEQTSANVNWLRLRPPSPLAPPGAFFNPPSPLSEIPMWEVKPTYPEHR